MPALTFDLLRSELDLSGEENRAWGRCWESERLCPALEHPPSALQPALGGGRGHAVPRDVPPLPTKPRSPWRAQRAQSAARMLSLRGCVGIPFPGIKQPLCRARY